MQPANRRAPQRQSTLVLIALTCAVVALLAYVIVARVARSPDPDQLPHCAAAMTAIPGGTFKMGEGGDTVTVQAYCLDVFEVTAGAYAACVTGGQCTGEALSCGDAATYRKANKSNHPINCVDWAQASAFCKAQGKRLPSEEEWEWAARGGDEARTYPWGGSEPEQQLCWSRPAQRTGTCAVGSFPEGDGRWGVRDLAGGVWEWTSSTYYDTSSRAQRVSRGGGWFLKVPMGASASQRYFNDPAERNDSLGFRCAQ